MFLLHWFAVYISAVFGYFLPVSPRSTQSFTQFPPGAVVPLQSVPSGDCGYCNLIVLPVLLKVNPKLSVFCGIFILFECFNKTGRDQDIKANADQYSSLLMFPPGLN